MSEDLTLFSLPELKDVVQDMRDLLSQSHLALLLGAGCSKNAGLPLMLELTEEVLGHDKIGEGTKKLLDTVRNLFSGAEISTIEDFMSEIVDLFGEGEWIFDKDEWRLDFERGVTMLGCLIALCSVGYPESRRQ